MRKFDIGVFAPVQVGDDLAPEQAGLHDVGLFHAAQAVLALAGEVEGDAGDTLDLAGGVGFRVEAALLAIRQGFHAARLTEVNAAGAFTHDHDVQAANHIRLQRGGIHQRVQHNGRAQIGEQIQFLAQAQNGDFRAHVEAQLVPLRAADGAEQDGVRFLRLGHHAVGDRGAARVDGGTADDVLGHVEGDHAAAVHPVDHAADFAHHFGADAVTRQDQ